MKRVKVASILWGIMGMISEFVGIAIFVYFYRNNKFVLGLILMIVSMFPVVVYFFTAYALQELGCKVWPNKEEVEQDNSEQLSDIFL